MKIHDLGKIPAIVKSKYNVLLSNYCYYKGITHLPYLPTDFIIETTSHCNLRCVMCPQSDGIPARKGFMDLGLFVKIMEQVPNNRAKITLHYRGEPLMHKSIIDMIKIAKEHNHWTRIHTNATLLNNELSENIIEAGLDELSFSFDGFTKEEYEEIRANAKYEDTLSNILNFLNMKKQMNSAKPYTILQKIVSENDYMNENKSFEDRDKFSGLPLDQIKYIPLHNWAGKHDTGFQPQMDRYKPCMYPWYRMVITWEGSVISCCNDMECRIVFGDVNKQLIPQIWNGEKIKRFRKKMFEGKAVSINPCCTCDLLYSKSQSNSGNASRNYIFEGIVLLNEKLGKT